ncbi:MAG: aspartate aminotransferase family protein [Verrucomicrobiota bacterium]
MKLPIPGPRSLALAEKLRRYECRNTTFVSSEFPIFWEKAHGAHVWDVDGNCYLDFTSGFGVAALGYTPEFSAKALKDQASILSHAMGDVHPTELKVRLCEKLSALTFESWHAGIGKTILSNSGAEAVEAALKTAWIATGKSGVIAFENSYHGLTCGALTVTGREDFRSPFQSALASFSTFLPFPREQDHLDSLETKIRSEVAKGKIGAILVEPILGRGGEVIPPDGFLKMLRRCTDDLGILLILDEIYVGWYRTGKRFACDHEGVVPDLICLGKAMTGFFPMGACVGKAAIMDRWPESNGEALHTSTFLGNPLGCRVALTQLEELEKQWGTLQLEEKSRALQKGLDELAQLSPCIIAPRTRGMLGAIDFVDAEGRADGARAAKVMIQALQSGLILLASGAHGNVLSFTPPFVISVEEIKSGIQILRKIIEESPSI